MRKLLHKESELSVECGENQMRKMIISAKKLHKDHLACGVIDISHCEAGLNDRSMRAALRYLRNLG